MVVFTYCLYILLFINHALAGSVTSSFIGFLLVTTPARAEKATVSIDTTANFFCRYSTH